MKSRWITVGLCLVAAVVLIVRHLPHGWGARQASSSVPRQGHAANAYMGLRSMVLDGTRANFGLGPSASRTEAFAVVMDWGDTQGATTVVAVADGSASVYYSNGDGSIGGGQTHEAIRNAALKAVELARVAQPSMQRTAEHPVAGRGQVSFYVVTDAGVFGATAAQEDLSGNRSPFSALEAAGQDIVAEYRRVEQK